MAYYDDTLEPYVLVSGTWKRAGHGDSNPPPPPPPPPGYDWTALTYGTAYDAAGGTGGYDPDATHSGVPSGTTYTSTVTGTSSYLTLSTLSTAKGTGTVDAATDTVTLSGHGLADGHPVWFTSLTGGSGLSTGVGNWYVVANSTASTFTLKKLDLTTGLFADVNVTASYTAAAVSAGIWYDRADFTCHIKISSGAVGILLTTRSRHRGPATAIDPATTNASIGLVQAVSATGNHWFLSADSDLVPDDPVNKLNGFTGYRARLWRVKVNATIDGIGSFGDTYQFGTYIDDLAYIYPDTVDGHSDGTHNDGVQVHGNATHVMLGCHIESVIDAAVSSTTDPTGHPAAHGGVGNAGIQVNQNGSLAVPTGLLISKCKLGGGQYTLNVAGNVDYPALGHVVNNRWLRNARYANISAAAVPSPTTKAGGATVHLEFPTYTGATGTNVWDDDSTTMTPTVTKGSDGAASTLVYP